MKPSIEKLQKFFKLEADRGYDNKAVMGGLINMLDAWIADARVDQIPEEIIQSVSLRLQDYERLSETSRKETLYGIWNRLKRELGEADENQIAAPVSEPPPPMAAQPETDLPVDSPPPAEPPPSAAATAPKPRQKTAKKRPEGPSAAFNAEVTVLPGVGERYAKTLEKLGIYTLGDILYHFPRRYDDYSELKPINRLTYGETVTIIGTVQSIVARNIRSGKTKLVETLINDGSAALKISWFNQPWVQQRLKKGMQIVVSGKIEQYLGRLTLNNPEWEPIEQKHLHTNRIVPVYPLTAKITQRWLRNIMHKVVMYWAPRIVENLPAFVLENADLMDIADAMEQVHFPDSWDLLKAARHRLAFDEIFLLQIGVLQQKQNWQERTAKKFFASDEWLERQLGRLPFTLTQAQQNAIQDIRNDLASGQPMNRLLQGDVGSGKTIVAATAAAIIANDGSQSALMAPTGILAEQHYQSLINILAGEDGMLRPNQIRLMIGATPEAEKQEIRDALAAGFVKIVVGTHALIEDPVNFANLELAIIDEQHRFGVQQRAALRTKGANPHLLVMTATPIPRSLALTVYGDLNLSVIDEMPPGRQPVETYVLYPKERERAYRLIKAQLEAGHQAFIIYPLVEESDKSEEMAAVEEHERLQTEIFPHHQLGLLHGRLKPAEKEDVMTRFRDGEYQILVSTSVVEVGVDVPNATVMLIEGAHRFGLAQLHQFRGRVGRGQAASYCLMIPQKAESVENERLQAMAESNDGFVLAEKDLDQRGAGDFLGTRQSGFSELHMAKLTDVKLIEKARKQAQALFEIDPHLTRPEHAGLVEMLARFWKEGQGDIS